VFHRTPRPSTDPRLRSLLQKAARRGFTNVVDRTLTRLEQAGDRAWVRSRAVVITFEECWPLGASLAVTREDSSRRKAVLRVTKAAKYKDAAALGTLAYGHHEGDKSMADCVPDMRSLELVSDALERPQRFFTWVRERSETAQSIDLINAAEQYLPAASWQWDKACILAAALLSTQGDMPLVRPAETLQGDFPYWVALDKHTPQGKVVLSEVARQAHASYRQLMWASFYCESALVNRLLPSPWWDAEKRWRLRRAGLTVAAAEALWSRARGLIRDRLSSEAAALQALVDATDSGRTPSAGQGRLFETLTKVTRSMSETHERRKY